MVSQEECMLLCTEYEIRHGKNCLLCGSLPNIFSGVLKYKDNVNRVCGKCVFALKFIVYRREKNASS